MFKKRRANKEIYAKISEWYRNGKKGAPSAYVGMTHEEFQEWCASTKLPRRFLT